MKSSLTDGFPEKIAAYRTETPATRSTASSACRLTSQTSASAQTQTPPINPRLKFSRKCGIFLYRTGIDCPSTDKLSQMPADRIEGLELIDGKHLSSIPM